ncbi:Plectin [Dissostichus eleginoides]|uniref:Plectin n=1 Tax=Dissostichus eleginoides TaxID=100907 RepID=A0AAD9FAW7_DISEL|nr:Plectin [Dissostichus eleginoides]
MVAGMLMPLRDLRAIYELLFKDGVMVAKKDKRPQIKHPEIESVSNLQVIRAMVSLKSRGYVKETFAWRHFYWYLTNEGIVYLRDYLRLPSEIVPASLQRTRKPAATMAFAQRAAQVQTVEGPTSYVPKPGRRGEEESQESHAERQVYRHRMMGPGEKETYSDRTPRFRGRPLTAEPVRPKASWEVEDQPQPLYRRGGGFRNEEAVMEESRVKRVSRQQADVSIEKVATTPQEKKVPEKIMAPMSVQNQRAVLKQDAAETTVQSAAFKPALPLSVAAVAVATGAATSKLPAESSTPKTNKERIADEKASTKTSQMVTSSWAITTLQETEVKEVKTKKVVVEPMQSAQVKPKVEMAKDEVEPQAVLTMVHAKKTTSFLTETAPPFITKPANKDVKEKKTKNVFVEPAKPAKEKVDKEPIKPTEVTPVECKIDQEKAKITAKVTVTQETTKLPPDSTASEPVLSTDAVKEISKVKVVQEPIDTKVTKTDESHQQTTIVTKSIHEVKTTITTTHLFETTASSQATKPLKGNATVTEIITKEKHTDVKETPQVKKDVKLVAEEVLQVSAPGVTLGKKVSCSHQLSQNVAPMQVAIETQQAVEGSSKSKRKKKKSPGEKSKSFDAEELPESKGEKEKTPEGVAKNTLKPETVMTSETLTDKANTNLPHMEPVKTEEITVTKVETVTVQKKTQIELIQASHNSAPESQKLTVETKSLIAKEKAAEESSKGKKKGRGKKQAQATLSDTTNTKQSSLPEAETLLSTDNTSLPKATVKASRVTTSEQTELNVSPKMTPERMCSEKTRRAAAVLCEAPADKEEVEPAPLFAEKVKREVPKPKTSSTAREAPAAGELASAAPAVTAQAAVAPTQASPLHKQEEPPIVSEHSASQAAERCTEKRLSASQALKQEEEKKSDSKKDTPSAISTPASAQTDQLHLGDTCESKNPETEEADMKRKIVVVEEIVEVKHVVSPEASGHQSTPPTEQPVEGGEELDLDVLEAIAIKRSLLAGAPGAGVQGASSDEEWDHSLDDPEEKTWPHFIEVKAHLSSQPGPVP